MSNDSNYSNRMSSLADILEQIARAVDSLPTPSDSPANSANTHIPTPVPPVRQDYRYYEQTLAGDRDLSYARTNLYVDPYSLDSVGTLYQIGFQSPNYNTQAFIEYDVAKDEFLLKHPDGKSISLSKMAKQIEDMSKNFEILSRQLNVILPVIHGVAELYSRQASRLKIEE